MAREENKVQQLQTQVRLERSLRDITNKIHSCTLDEILIKVKEDIQDLIQADRVTIYAVETSRKEIYSKLLVAEEIKEIRVPVSRKSLAGFAAVAKKFLKVSDAYNAEELSAIDPELQFDSSWDAKTGFKTTQVMACPIMQNGRVQGVLQVVNKIGKDDFDDSDASVVRDLAESLGIAFANQRKITGRRSRFDHLLLNQIVSDEDMDKAQAIAQEEQGCVETVLMEKFKVPKEEIGVSLSEFYRCEFVSYSDEVVVPEDLIMDLDLALLKNHSWVPLKEDHGVLHVVMADPKNIFYRDEIKEQFSGKQVKFLVTTHDDVIAFIDRFFGAALSEGESLGELIGELDFETPLEEKEKEKEEEASEDDSATVKLVNKVIVDAYNQGASDIHLEPYPDGNMEIRFRVDGVCAKVAEVPRQFSKAVVSRLKIMSELDIAEKRLPQDGKIKFKNYGPLDIELRVATLPTAAAQEDCVMRILAASKPIPLEKIGMPSYNYDRFLKIVEEPYGLVLVCGPTGSGKTTTLHSVLGHINTPDRKIWTAEDPVEITQRGLRQVQVKAKIGYTFARALRAFLRADPDVAMIGEMRDEETAAAGIEMSLTGHLVFSTLHTNNAPETITRLLDMGLDPFSFGDSLLCVLAQRLVRTLCKKCKEPRKATQEEIDGLIMEYGGQSEIDRHKVDLSNVEIFEAKGCSKCGKKGYKGRAGIHELMVSSDEIKLLIYNKAKANEIRELAVEQGMILLKQDGIRKALSGLTDMKEIRRVCAKK